MSHTFDPADAARKALEEALKTRGKVNIVVAGRTGVGKSTLINEVFQGNLAKTGQGRPVTTGTREITKEGIPVSIFDTRGLELADFKTTLDELTSFIVKRNGDTDPMQHVHLAWLCITEASARVEDAEIDLCKTLAGSMPVIGVITKCHADKGFRATVQELLPNTRNVVRVRALQEVLDDNHHLPTIGLQELVDLSMEVVPDGQRNAFAAAQKVSLGQKTTRAERIVVGSATSAAVVALSPVPFSDAVLLVPIQVSMLAGITAIFGIDLSRGILITLVTSTFASTGATLIGKTIVGNLLKLLPGGGTLLGGIINAGTATILTTLIGQAYIATLKYLFEKPGGSPPSPEEIVKEFKRRYQSGSGQ